MTKDVRNNVSPSLDALRFTLQDESFHDDDDDDEFRYS